MRRLGIAVAALLTTLVVEAAPARSYCLQRFSNVEGDSTWRQQEVPYFISDNLQDQQKIAAIEAAFSTWASVPCSTLRFRMSGTFALSSVPFRDHAHGIHVFWHTDAGAYPAEPRFISHALVSVEADADGKGEIRGGSIAINAFSQDVVWATDGNPNAFDLQGEMTERVGQVIGLETSNATETVMRRYLKLGDVDKRTLKQDDINAVTYLYGEGCPVQPPAPGPDGCAPPPPATSSPDAGVGRDSGTVPWTDAGSINIEEGRCTTGTQCAPDEVCSFEGYCIKAGGGSDEGCSCSVRQPSQLGWISRLGWIFLPLGCCLLVRRRVRR